MARVSPEEITVRLEMTDEVRAIFDEAMREIDAMRSVVDASIRLHRCLGEHWKALANRDYDAVESACLGPSGIWAEAVIAFKRQQDEVLRQDAESRPPLVTATGRTHPVDVEVSVRTGYVTYKEAP